MAAEFLRRVDAHFANETAVVTANGILLDRDLDEGLKCWRTYPLLERKRLEDLGRYDPALDPQPPPGGLVLNVFARPLERASDGRWRLYLNPKAPLSQEPGRDHLWLTTSEAHSFLPSIVGSTDSWAVAPALVDRFCRRYLIDLVRIGGNGGPRSIDDIESQSMEVSVTENTASTVRLSLKGFAAYRTRGPEFGVPVGQSRVDRFEILGQISFDRLHEQFHRFDIIALSSTGHFDEIGRQSTPLGVGFSISEAKSPADRSRPSSYGNDYFGR